MGSQLQSGFLTVNAPWTGGRAADKVQVVNTGLITAVLGAPPVSPFKNAKGSIDPSKTLVAGVIFGTTAESDGLFATIEASEVAAPRSLWLLAGGLLTLRLASARAYARGKPARRRGPAGEPTLRRTDGQPAAR